MRDVKRFLFIMSAVGTVLFFAYLITYAVNEAYIRQYEKEEYNISYLSVMGFTESYVYPYNTGCSYYRLGFFEEAEARFTEALQANPPRKGDKDCKVRINSPCPW